MTIHQAYRQLVAESGFPAVRIGALHRRLGCTLEVLQGALLWHHQHGASVLSSGDWSLASPEDRAAAIHLHGEPMLLVRFL